MRREFRSREPAIEQYLEEIWLARGLSENTLAAYRRDLDALELSLARRRLTPPPLT